MNLDSAIKRITETNDLEYADVLQVVYGEIEQYISSFREEIRLAKNVETLHFLRRTIWDSLFAENTGVYYSLCKRSHMLKLLRLNADIRYCELLERLRRNEQRQISYIVVAKHAPKLQPHIVDVLVEETNGELVENEIIYNI